ncbi:MAG: DNA-directed RNA polymerase subunit alpha [Chloroflexi bacterium]|nr:DNA-directed RNA polymerase subunit alpha [Chloroflexota bacterium]
MSNLPIPNITSAERRDNYGRFVVEPLEKGSGITMGNAMRRMLLGHLTGAAVTQVKIDGAQHEFSVIPHVKEDTIEFLLNVKMLRLKPISDRPGKLILEAEGEGAVSAAAIKPSADFEIINPELHLATLDSPEARLYVEFDVELGQGYREAMSGNNLPIGVIPVDAIFSPVRKVNYTIEPVHVGRETSQERLSLEVWTDGTISPEDAISRSASLLTEQFSPFIEYAKASKVEKVKESIRLSIPPEKYNMPIEELNLSVRTLNCLRRSHITTVGELISEGEQKLMTLRNFGQKSRREVEERLSALGLSLTPSAEEETQHEA